MGFLKCINTIETINLNFLFVLKIVLDNLGSFRLYTKII
jgi:hypothetical protein